jgi:7-cyano-7-deazaguanine synthase
MVKSALVLCSGGLDSVTTAFFVEKRLAYDNLGIIFFDYAQKSLFHERRAALFCAQSLKATFYEIRLPELGKLSFSLINKEGYVQQLSPEELGDTQAESLRFYVPGRNTLFLSYALALAESLAHTQPEQGVPDIFIGFKNDGSESFPDTTQSFLDRMNALASVACLRPASIAAPLITYDKEDIVALGGQLGVDFTKTWSCYQGKEIHCGSCLACRLRQAGFTWSGISDPTAYLVQNSSSPQKQPSEHF